MLTWEIKVANISEQQLRLPSGISGPPTAADNFSTNVFLASNKYHQLWKEILNDSPAEILLLKKSHLDQFQCWSPSHCTYSLTVHHFTV